MWIVRHSRREIGVVVWLRGALPQPPVPRARISATAHPSLPVTGGRYAARRFRAWSTTVYGSGLEPLCTTVIVPELSGWRLPGA